MTLPRAAHCPSSTPAPPSGGGKQSTSPTLTEGASVLGLSPSWSLPPSGASWPGRNWAGNRPLTTTGGPCQVSLPLSSLGRPPHCPLQGNQGWGARFLKGPGHALRQGLQGGFQGWVQSVPRIAAPVWALCAPCSSGSLRLGNSTDHSDPRGTLGLTGEHSASVSSARLRRPVGAK